MARMTHLFVRKNIKNCQLNNNTNSYNLGERIPEAYLEASRITMVEF